MSDFTLEFPDSNSQPEPSQEISQPDDQFQSVAEGFLKNIPDQDRPIVEKYVRDWDQGVSARFRKLHETYEPYKNLGSIEDIQNSLLLHQKINADPLQFFYDYQAAIKQLQEEGIMPMFEEDGIDTGDESEIEQPVQFNNDPQLVDRLSNLESMLEQLATNWQDDYSKRQEEAGMQQLDGYLTDLHKTHGNFNEDYVLLMLSRGMDGEQAVQAWKSVVSGELGANKPTPPRLFGNGGHPGQSEPKFNNKPDRLAFIEQVARNANSNY